MKPDMTHPDYDKWLEEWSKLRDCIEGERAVKKAGTAYLPKLSGQTPDEYDAYKIRAGFFNATGRTREGLVGAILRKDPEVSWPEAKALSLETVGVEAETITELIHRVLGETIGIGRFGLLVDAPAFSTPSQTSTGDPYLASYDAETIVNWEESVIDGRRTPIKVVLRETLLVENKDGELEDQVQYRILRLGGFWELLGVFPTSEDEEMTPEERAAEYYGITESDFTANKGVAYWQEIWIEDQKKKDEWLLRDLILPRFLGGAALDRIPFVFFNSESTRPVPSVPPLNDLADVNVSHYRNSADLEHGLHFTALPTAFASGFDTAQELTIGSARAWVTKHIGATAGYLEFSGAGLASISEAMEAKQKRMAVLGARLLEESPKSVEAAETVKLRQRGEESALSRTARVVSEGLTKALQVLGRWLGVADVDSIMVSLNQDFGTASISSDMLLALMQAAQGGMISWNTFFYNVKRGEIIPDDVEEDDEMARILEGIPGMPVNPLEEEETEEEEEEEEET